MPSIRTLLVACLAAATGTAAFDCRAIRPDSSDPKWVVDLSAAMKKPMVFTSTESTPPSTTETTVMANLCAPLDPKAAPRGDTCPRGTSVCMVVSNTRDGVTRVERVIPYGLYPSNAEPQVASSVSHECASVLTSVRALPERRCVGDAAKVDVI